MLKCSVVMTENPCCCLPTDTVETAACLMKEENVGCIPVIEGKESMKLVGIVTDRDLAMQLVGNTCDPCATVVGDVMTSHLITCHYDDDLQRAMDSMAKFQLRRIPIVDDNHKIVGIISQGDVATRVDQPEETGIIVREISQPHIDSDPFENKGHQEQPGF